MRTGIEEIDRYCQKITDGRIPACRWVRKAVERHYHDLERQATKKFPYYFSPKHAEHFISFAQSLKQTKGQFHGRLLVLEDWQKFVYGSLFGWLHMDTRTRRFHEAYIEIPKKNGKSILGAVVGLYGLVADGEMGAEIYCLATNRMQASQLSYEVAVNMIEQNEELSSLLKINKGMATMGIYYPAAASYFKPLTSKPKSLDGFNPHMAINDEVKDWADMSVYDMIDDGTATRTESLLYNVTTAGENRRSLGYVKREYLTKVLDGVQTDENFFGIIYTIDEEDLERWDDIEVWKKANPNFGISIQEQYWRKQVRSARESQRKKNDVLTKNLNVWITAFDQWMDLDSWNACGDPDLTIDQVKHLPCIIALDLASKIDIAVMLLMFYGDSRFYFFLKSYLPEEYMDRGDALVQDYKAWSDEGYITLTPGARTDQDYIKADILEACQLYDVQKIAFDPFQATKLVTELEKENLPLLEYRHTVLNMSEPMKEVEACVLEGSLVHPCNPVLTWMFSNVVAREDAKENIYPRKKDEEHKIDGAVAAIMAMGTYIFTLKEDEESELSPYARRAMQSLNEEEEPA